MRFEISRFGPPEATYEKSNPWIKAANDIADLQSKRNKLEYETPTLETALATAIAKQKIEEATAQYAPQNEAANYGIKKNELDYAPQTSRSKIEQSLAAASHSRMLAERERYQMLNPPREEEVIRTSDGLFTRDKRTGALSPVQYNGKQLSPYAATSSTSFNPQTGEFRIENGAPVFHPAQQQGAPAQQQGVPTFQGQGMPRPQEPSMLGAALSQGIGEQQVAPQGEQQITTAPGESATLQVVPTSTHSRYSTGGSVVYDPLTGQSLGVPTLAMQTKLQTQALATKALVPLLGSAFKDAYDLVGVGNAPERLSARVNNTQSYANYNAAINTEIPYLIDTVGKSMGVELGEGNIKMLSQSIQPGNLETRDQWRQKVIDVSADQLFRAYQSQQAMQGIALGEQPNELKVIERLKRSVAATLDSAVGTYEPPHFKNAEAYKKWQDSADVTPAEKQALRVYASTHGRRQ